MNDLETLQRTFARHVRHPGRGMRDAVLTGKGASVTRRLSVYSDGYRARLVEVLRADYPALVGVLGGAGFARMACDFIHAHPSGHPNLRWYGAGLGGYLRRSSRWRRRPVLAELACFEWALGLAFDAADERQVTADDAGRVPPAAWAGMCLRLHPSVQLLRLRSNAPKLWKADDAGEVLPGVSMRKRTSGWLVWRKGHEPFFRPLPPGEAWALEAVARGRDFAALVGGLRRFVGTQSAAQAGAQFLRNWLDEGLIGALRAT